MPAFLAWPVIKLFFSGVLGKFGSAASSAIAFLRAHSVWLTVSIALCLAWGVDHVISHRHIAKVEKQLTAAINALAKEHAGRVADRKTYIKAQADAKTLNDAHNSKIEQQYQRISSDEKDAYARDHAELVRLRQQSAPAPQRAAGTTDTSKAPAPAAGADGHAMQLSSDEYLQAQEIELRLMHLQNYVEELLKVDPNK